VAPVRPTALPKRRAHDRAGRAFLTVSSSPWGVLYLDGHKIADETPVYRLAVPEGAHRVAVFFPARGTYSTSQSISLHAGETRVLGFKP
jgi:hypothetical protein